MKASMLRGCSRTVNTWHSVSSSNEMPLLTPFYQYLQVHEKNGIKTTIHHARTCSCSPMRVEILPKIQAPLILSFTPLSSPLFLIWPKRLMTFVSWRHPVPDERSGQPHLWTHNKESQCQQCCRICLLQDLDQEPVVKQLTSDPVEIKADHFSQPLCGSDSSHGALNFPIPEVRYLIKEISVVWHLYGGKDFRSPALTASPSRSRGWASSCSDGHAKLAIKTTNHFIYYYYISDLHPIAPPPRLPSDKPRVQAVLGEGEEGTLMCWWRYSSVR